MSDTPETDDFILGSIPKTDWMWRCFARQVERKWNEAKKERDEARRELDETISCIEQAVDFHQVHHQFNSATAIKNLLENIKQRRKHD